MTTQSQTLTFQGYMEYLKLQLIPRYTPPHVPAGNDRHHCDRMARFGPYILGIQGLPEQGRLQFDMDEYDATCWLHNIDVTTTTKIPFAEAEERLRRLLEPSPFDETTQARIINNIRVHGKFADEPGDNHCLTAIRIADKVDRLIHAPIGIIAAPSMRGVQILMYDPNEPFNYTSTAENKLKSIYADYMRHLEWYGMLPSDEARHLVPLSSMRFYVEFVRRFAVAIADHLGVANGVEDDLRKALGKYYEDITKTALIAVLV